MQNKGPRIIPQPATPKLWSAGMSAISSRTLLATLIGFPTVSRDSNLALIEFIRDYLPDSAFRAN